MQFYFRPEFLQKISAKVYNRRLLTQSFTGFEVKELTNSLKRDVESYWRKNLVDGHFTRNDADNKFYVLSMFPYPSGNLHMGHVRVYTISDSIARFHRMNGKNVFHPIGWDAFGLPAENAANQRNIKPADWTRQNIEQMKEQLLRLGCSFDWEHELSTCDASYYKWTQKIFLLLYEEGLAYQNEALVNWDPVDKTVLADEQVDANGCSWRSGAKVEKKLLKQWFIQTTKFARNLLDGLEDPSLKDWRDIISLQRHWIGDCNGYAFQFPTSANNSIRIWTEFPEYLLDRNAYIVLKSNHHMRKMLDYLTLTVHNPITDLNMSVVFSDEVEFPEKCDVYLASPHFVELDMELHQKFGLPISNFTLDGDVKSNRLNVLDKAKRLKVGGQLVSSKLQDWLISRQRYWGTPIPIIHCSGCGVVPVPEADLPVLLPSYSKRADEEIFVNCPKCGCSNAKRETDTMDTFVDSSWYYLRYLDPHNSREIFDKRLTKKLMPVDLYVGGKEHAVLHLYYARFMCHFLHSKGLVPTSEPFSRLLVQGMVMGKSFRVKGSGRYVKENEVEIIDRKKNKAITKDTNESVVMSWEKMSKSKLNGVEPNDMFSEYGTDTTRLIILGDVAPTSHRNWSNATFSGILNWQKRLWLTVEEFCELRSAPAPTELVDDKSEEFLKEDDKLFDSRNFYAKGVTFNFLHTHQLSVAISKMQGLTNSLRRAPKDVIRYGKQFEHALAGQIIMLAPMAPHFASELWSKFAAAPNRLNKSSDEIQWDKDVLHQQWPEVDSKYKVDLTIKINGLESAVIKIARSHIDKITHNDALDLAFDTDSVTSCLVDRKIKATNFVLYPGIEGILYISVNHVKQTKEIASTPEEVSSK